MERFVLRELDKWKNSPRRKPLVIRGARQVGKTWALKAFGDTFPDGYAYFNFDRQPELAQFFATTKDTSRILNNLAMVAGRRLTPQTLLIFDEIQSCEDALNTLKYFCEDKPEYYIACAGSLLGLQLAKGFPVGKVNFIGMEPMSFSEFLLAEGEKTLYAYLTGLDRLEALPDAFFHPLSEALKRYFVTGGMPEAVLTWAETRDVSEVETVLSNILLSYETDFGKHAPADAVPRIHSIWASLPSQLARENKKFLYSVVKPGARAREYEDALNWLCQADLTGKVYRISRPGLPLCAYDDLNAFKIYMLDVGLLRRHSHLSYTAFSEDTRLFTEFKGALTENYVFQAIRGKVEGFPRYWSEIPSHEVDFVIQMGNDVLPLECKAGSNVKAASLKKYAADYAESTPLLIRTSMKNLSFDGKVLNVPLFLLDRLPAFLLMAKEALVQ